MNAEVNLTELKEYYGFQNESAWIWKNTLVFIANLVGFGKILQFSKRIWSDLGKYHSLQSESA